MVSVGTRINEMTTELDMPTALRDKPAGTGRITCGPDVLCTTLLPKLTPLLREYPDIHIEFDANHVFRDIVADRFDAGVRMGDTIDKDMITGPVGPKLRAAAVASPDYFSRNSVPQTPHELTQHQRINQRMVKSGGLYVWNFDRDDDELKVWVSGQLTFNTSEHIVDAALAGFGIAFLPEEEPGTHIEEGRLIRILESWCSPFPGYYLYYPRRKQPSPAFSLAMEALRHKRPWRFPLSALSAAKAVIKTRFQNSAYIRLHSKH